MILMKVVKTMKNLNYINLKLLKQHNIISYIGFFIMTIFIIAITKNIAVAVIATSAYLSMVLNTRLNEIYDRLLILSLPTSRKHYYLNIILLDLISIIIGIGYSLLMSYILKLFLISVKINTWLVLLGLCITIASMILRNICKMLFSHKAFVASYGGINGGMMGLCIALSINNKHGLSVSQTPVLISLLVLTALYLLTYTKKPEVKL